MSTSRRNPSTIRCAVFGASGYSGAELVSLLAVHPDARIVALGADGSAGERWERLHPHFRHLFTGTLRALTADDVAGVDVAFLALPHGESARVASTLRGRVGRVIDLSGDLRLADPALYRRWYGREHPAPALLADAVYGLPELFGDALPGARLVACAGCYPTVSQLAAAPLLASWLGAAPRIVVTATSGTSGAGRKAELALSFTEVAGSLRAYRVGRHQHTPEIVQGLQRLTGEGVSVTFVPQLGPLPRGILATVVAENRAGRGQQEVLAAFRTFYSRAPFVRVVDPAERLPAVADVLHTNFCDLAPVVDEEGGSVVVVGVIDNLQKGAAGQAVQVMNQVLGLPETTGLLPASEEASLDGDEQGAPVGVLAEA